jgi:hypothetical protein
VGDLCFSKGFCAAPINPKMLFVMIMNEWWTRTSLRAYRIVPKEIVKQWIMIKFAYGLGLNCNIIKCACLPVVQKIYKKGNITCRGGCLISKKKKDI